MTVSQSLRKQVLQRANSCCEYCGIPQVYDPIPFEIDHVTPRKLRGPSTLENLALACFYCNNHKGPNIGGIDPETKQRAFFYNPRTDEWSEHLEWNQAMLKGLTPEGRATIEVLEINRPDRVAVRKSLLEEGVFPQRGSPIQ